MSKIIQSILVANRGEIAVRVLRTAKALGYRTITIYSEADANAPHVKLADESVLIGPAPVADSYLNPQRILAAASDSGADAIHPGYGFLSENADFARACEQASVIFIGPGADAIALMGNKATAKRCMLDAGVPCVPGYEGEDQSGNAFEIAAANIGYPIMVKAAAGGGGRGMRLVQEPDGLGEALTLARSEALNAFGSDELILEKAIARPRHVEVQVFADNHGNVIHLGERDCSVQRRHQKIIEEAPCPIMTDELRTRMGDAAVSAAKSIGYRGAGTVEFLLDESGSFYFLEMNARLQVEHPVTEMITGLDLVEMQISVACGEPLSMTQGDLQLHGHAIEVRLYAEDTSNNFMPSAGRIEQWLPAGGDGIRVDAGIASGLDVSPYYDSMLAKIIAHGESRQQALARLTAALADTALFGPATNRDFLINAVTAEQFVAGEATTAFVGEAMATNEAGETSEPLAAIAAVLLFRQAAQDAFRAAVRVPPELRNWSSTGDLASRLTLQSGNRSYTLTVSPIGADEYSVADVTVGILCIDGASATIQFEGRKSKLLFHQPRRDEIFLATKTSTAHFTGANGHSEDSEMQAGGRVVAPMHGQLLEVFVSKGDKVEKGARLAVLEAMKMQHEIRARVAGVVKALYCDPGVQIAAKALILEIEEPG